MKISLLYAVSTTESWVQEAQENFLEKLKPFCDIQIHRIKSPTLSRKKATEKVRKEEELFLKKISPEDYLVLLDEKGRKLDSIEFSNFLETQSPRSLIFLVGGAFGVGEKILQRAQTKLCLSNFTMNHWLAQLVILEQIYRGLTILKKIPYHNI